MLQITNVVEKLTGILDELKNNNRTLARQLNIYEAITMNKRIRLIIK